MEWCEEHCVIRDKALWQDLVWHAIRNALSASAKASLKRLLALDYAPLDKEDFYRCISRNDFQRAMSALSHVM